MYRAEYRDVEQQCRQQRRLGDVEIGHFHDIRHQEGRRPHDRRHQLPAGRGHRLYSAGHRGPIAGAAHERNADGAGGQNICHRCSRNHPHQAAADDGSLCRPTA